MKNKTKHTPGPWYICDEYEGAIPIDAPPASTGRDDSVEICRVSYDSESEQAANAALIAAAPEMLAQLKQLYAAHKFSLDTGAAYVVDEMAVTFIAAAIAKAEGK